MSSLDISFASPDFYANYAALAGPVDVSVGADASISGSETPAPNAQGLAGWEVASRLRGFALIALLVVGIDWSTSWLAQRYLSTVIHNPTPPPVVLLIVLVIGFSSLMFLFKSRLGLIGCAMCAGGSIANIISRVAFGPVVDFIPEPLRGGWQCDPADLAVWSGSIIVVIALFLFFRDSHRAERAKRAAPAPSEPTAVANDWDW